MENLCNTCLIQILCNRMCEKALPYYQTLTFTDPNFNVHRYNDKRERLTNQWIEEECDAVKTQEIRDKAEDITYKEIQQSKETKNVETRGTKILRTFKHFSPFHRKD